MRGGGKKKLRSISGVRWSGLRQRGDSAIGLVESGARRCKKSLG